jgi:DNA-binding PadR family transcriptional regulator
MAVRNALLALLHEGPKHGYQLKAEFESATGGTWPLNIGQVYTTLQRLERDGLVEPATTEVDDERQRPVQITAAGRAELESWLTATVDQDPPRRDELAVKLLVVIATSAADPATVLQHQRGAALERLQRLTRLKRDADDGDLGWLMVVDHLILQTDAEARWLDLCEQRLRQAGPDAMGRAARAAADRAGEGDVVEPAGREIGGKR